MYYLLLFIISVQSYTSKNYEKYIWKGVQYFKYVNIAKNKTQI